MITLYPFIQPHHLLSSEFPEMARQAACLIDEHSKRVAIGWDVDFEVSWDRKLGYIAEIEYKGGSVRFYRWDPYDFCDALQAVLSEVQNNSLVVEGPPPWIELPTPLEFGCATSAVRKHSFHITDNLLSDNLTADSLMGSVDEVADAMRNFVSTIQQVGISMSDLGQIMGEVSERGFLDTPLDDED